ncbi:MAG: DNA-directed RNA polymerase subunit L [Nitrososphaerota archaeon]|nr:DNA-directed RNA polymerase subunit L [Nitrososphaerota archaeon]
MEIRVLESGERYVKIEVDGEDHTLLHALQDEALKDDNVEYIGYHIPYPLERKGIIIVRVKSGDPISVLKKVAERIIDDIDEISKLLLEAVKRA